MRVVDRKSFLALPAGTIYAKGRQWRFGGLAIKGESTHNDWYCIDPAWIESENSEEAFDRLEMMLTNHVSFPFEDAESRDGLFDEDAIFLVFELSDLVKLRSLIDNAIAISA